MKRSEMKRTGRLKRTTELRADPEKAQAWQERARAAGLSRDPMKMQEFVRRRTKPMRRQAQGAAAKAAKRRGEGPLTPTCWRLSVALASEMRCMVTGTRADDPFDPLFDAHHPVPKRELRARGLHEFVYDPRNGVFVLHAIHWDHEYSPDVSKRIPREALPASVWEFCRQLDELAGSQWATAMVERKHPAAGSSGTSSRRHG